MEYNRANQKSLAFVVSAEEIKVCLELLYEDLKGRYISKKTTLRQWMKLFSGKKVSRKVDWVAESAELKYLILRLLGLGAIGMPKGHSHWQCVANCFTIQGVEKSFVQLGKERNLQSAARRKAIDRVLLDCGADKRSNAKVSEFTDIFSIVALPSEREIAH